jgi:hypothetical protein
MSHLDTSFTFRLTRADKAALADLADRLGCDRGAALRRMIRQTTRDLASGSGQFASNGHTFQLRLQPAERAR